MIKELAYILAISQHGTVSKAAAALYISQPSLSRYVKELEAKLSIQLFYRINNRLVPTYAGEKYIETAKQITALYGSLEEDLRDINEALTGRLKIGCAILRMAYNMPTIIKSFIIKYPRVDLQLFEYDTTKGLETLLLNGDIDLAMINNRNIPKLTYLPFLDEELLLAVPKSQSIATKGQTKNGLYYPWIDIRTLHNQPYISLDGDQSIAMAAKKVFESNHIKPATVLKVKSVESAFRLAEVGVGCAIVPETLTRIRSVNDGPHLFSFGNPTSSWNLSIAYRENATLSNVAIEFIKTALNIYKQENTFTAKIPLSPFS